MLEKVFANDKTAAKLKMKHHDRPINDLLFNNDGDLIFSASKSEKIVLANIDGEPLGVYKGHLGAVNSICCSADSGTLISGSSDFSIIVWDVMTGKLKKKSEFTSRVSFVSHYPKSECVLITCDNSFNQKPLITAYDLRSDEFVFNYVPNGPVTSSIIDYSANYIAIGDNDGVLTLYDTRKNEVKTSKNYHSARITKLRPSFCSTYFATASHDGSVKIFDFENLNHLKTFLADEQINDVSIFPTNDKIACAGGTSARDVTTSKGKKEFDVRFYDIVTQKYIGCYSPHFGTINAMQIHPSSEIFCSGGEDAFVNVVKFGRDFYETTGFTNIYE